MFNDNNSEHTLVYFWTRITNCGKFKGYLFNLHLFLSLARYSRHIKSRARSTLRVCWRLCHQGPAAHMRSYRLPFYARL